MTGKTERLYEFLADDEDARVCTEISDSACREVPGNFFTIFVSQFLTRLADALASAKIVLPWLLTSAGAPPFLSGMLVPVRESGSLLPQLIIGGFVRRHEIRKWYFVVGSVVQGLAVCAMAWASLFLQGLSAGLAIMGLLILFSLARGLCSIASKDVLGKTIPKTKRGLLAGYCASAAGVVTIMVGAQLYFKAQPDSSAFTILLLGAGLCWLIAAISYARIREFGGETEGGGNALKEAVRSLSLLRTDCAFRNFVLMRCLLMSSGLAAPYFIILARQSSTDASFINLGLFIVVGGVASLISGVIWGRFADMSSRKVMLLTAMLTTLLCATASVLALSSVEIYSTWLVILFFLLSVTHQGVRLGRKTYVVDLAQGNRRTDYVAVSNTVIGLMLLIVGLGGATAAQFSISAVLAFFALTGLLAFMTGLRLPEV